MSKSDLFDEAVADAQKLVDTAYAKAKQELQEAFTPQLKSMLATKIAEMKSVDAEEEPTVVEPEPEPETTLDDEEIKEILSQLEQEMGVTETSPLDPPKPDPIPKGSEEGGGEEPVKETSEAPLEQRYYTLEDIKNVVRELLQSPSNVAEQATTPSSDSVVETVAVEEDVVKEEPAAEAQPVVEQSVQKTCDKDDKSMEEQLAEATSTLDTANQLIEQFRAKLQELNTYNAQLLHSTKLFLEFDLSNTQKTQILDAFKQAKSVRETEVVYGTLKEGFIKLFQKGTRTKSLHESASRVIPSTKPSEDILPTQGGLVQRWQHLAGIK